MSTREQIADRIREEHRKHPTLDWADIAAAKILSAMREEAQPSQTEDLENIEHKCEVCGAKDWMGGGCIRPQDASIATTNTTRTR